MQLQYYSAIIEDILEKQKQISSLESNILQKYMRYDNIPQTAGTHIFSGVVL